MPLMVKKKAKCIELERNYNSFQSSHLISFAERAPRKSNFPISEEPTVQENEAAALEAKITVANLQSYELPAF